MRTAIEYTFTAIDELQSADVPPSAYAIAAAKRLISEAGETKLIGRAHTSGGGELRVEWQHGDRAVRLVVASSPEYAAYVYWENGTLDDSDTEEIVADDTLYRWLNWVSK